MTISQGRDRRVHQTLPSHIQGGVGIYARKSASPSTAASPDSRTGTERRVAIYRAWVQQQIDVGLSWHRYGNTQAITKFTIDEHDARVNDLVARLRHSPQGDAVSRRDVVAAIQGERVDAESTKDPGDVSYNLALDHALYAIEHIGSLPPLSPAKAEAPRVTVDADLANAARVYLDAWNARGGEYHDDCPCLELMALRHALATALALLGER